MDFKYSLLLLNLRCSIKIFGHKHSVSITNFDSSISLGLYIKLMSHLCWGYDRFRTWVGHELDISWT